MNQVGAKIKYGFNKESEFLSMNNNLKHYATHLIKKNENNNHYNQTILVHDDIKKPSTLTALPNLIEKVIAKGYIFKTLNEKSNIIQHTKI